jgi:hypothetical protein
MERWDTALLGCCAEQAAHVPTIAKWLKRAWYP